MRNNKPGSEPGCEVSEAGDALVPGCNKETHQPEITEQQGRENGVVNECQEEQNQLKIDESFELPEPQVEKGK